MIPGKPISLNSSQLEELHLGRPSINSTHHAPALHLRPLHAKHTWFVRRFKQGPAKLRHCCACLGRVKQRPTKAGNMLHSKILRS